MNPEERSIVELIVEAYLIGELHYGPQRAKYAVKNASDEALIMFLEG